MTHPANAEEVGRSIEFIAGLADAGLAEMRALIFEHRPESLRNEGLVAALEKHGEAMRARHELEVVLDLGAEPEIGLQEKEALYHVAQEALNNIARHAAGVANPIIYTSNDLVALSVVHEQQRCQRGQGVSKPMDDDQRK